MAARELPKETATRPSLEPLADYLEPRFGNIYDCEFDEVQPWTPELRAAVTDYLVHEVSDGGYKAFVDEISSLVDEGSRITQAATIIELNQPWEIAFAFRRATVKALPSLRSLISDTLASWEDEDQGEDVRDWLQARATYDQLADAARLLGLDIVSQPRPVAHSDEELFATVDLATALTNRVRPSALLQAYEDVTGSAASDLTDQEWELIKSCLHGAYDSERRSFNGILYCDAYPDTRLPVRYGSARYIAAELRYHRNNGTLARMLDAVADKPEGGRLQAWLQKTGTTQPTREQRERQIIDYIQSKPRGVVITGSEFGRLLGVTQALAGLRVRELVRRGKLTRKPLQGASPNHRRAYAYTVVDQ